MLWRYLDVKPTRIALAVGLGLVIGWPLVQPFARLLDAGTWQWQPGDLERIAQLAANTLLLVGGTCLLAVPAGALLAVILVRSELPGRQVLLAVLVLLLFVPVPLIVSSWQAMLGAGGLLPIALWVSGVDRPWATGWGPAIWVHALAALPWVACIVGLGLRWVEPELEEEAALQMPPWRVVWQVTLPRCRASIAAAALFVALQTAGDISVTDMVLVSTLAEEVYTQFTIGGAALGHILLLALPWLIVLVVLLMLAVARLERALPPLPVMVRGPRPVIARPGWPWLLFLAVVFAVLIVPASGLVWRLGEAGLPRYWSPAHAWHQLTWQAWLLGRPLLLSIGTALASGVLVAGVAIVACWLARDSVLLRAWLLVLLTSAWVMPGPVVGIGLKELIMRLVRDLPEGPWDPLLYYGPSPLPILWAHVMRFLPAAVLFLWPVVRLIPRGLIETAHLQGAGPLRELLFVVWPMTRRAAGLIALATAALALGELAAAGRVETPRWESFARLLFDRMHYGAASDVAALSLLLLLAVSAAALLVMGVRTMVGAFIARR
jgi:iron(III) transport system permease protein